jgi:hypothetical protein
METKGRDLKGEIKEERLRNKKMVTVEPLAVELEEWQTLRKEALPLEREHLEIRVVLRDAEAALRSNPEDEYLKACVKYLKKRLDDLDTQAPWISSDAPREILLWGETWGC